MLLLSYLKSLIIYIAVQIPVVVGLIVNFVYVERFSYPRIHLLYQPHDCTINHVIAKQVLSETLYNVIQIQVILTISKIVPSAVFNLAHYYFCANYTICFHGFVNRRTGFL